MNTYQARAKIFKALAHPVRLHILELLALGPSCVCDLVIRTGHRQAFISQHLALLRAAGLVCANREGLFVWYSLAHPAVEQFLKALVNLKQGKNYRLQGARMNDKNNMWHGIPRSEIDWQPMIVGERCIGCGMCATSCGRGVYAFDYEQNQPVVVAPEMCMVGCTTCATLCTQDAIEFPSTGYIRQLIRQKKLLRQSKDILRDNREKYDLKVRGVGSI